MTKAEAAQLIRAQKGRFYIYQLGKPDGTPFYIGKGIGQRVFAHELEATGPGLSRKLNTIRKIISSGQSISYEILSFYDCEKDCHNREIEEILRLGRLDLQTGSLTNLTSGGEGASGLSEETKARIDADLHGPDAPGERGIANRFFLQLCSSVQSVPVRPLSNSKPRALSPLPESNNPTPRMAAALSASAIANRVLLTSGCKIPRRMFIEDKPMIIEFGASTNILRAGLAILEIGNPAGHEVFVLSQRGFDAISQFVSTELLMNAGVLMPRVV